MDAAATEAVTAGEGDDISVGAAVAGVTSATGVTSGAPSELAVDEIADLIVVFEESASAAFSALAASLAAFLFAFLAFFF